MATREEITLFDRYLRGEMEASEKDAFEVRLEKSEKRDEIHLVVLDYNLPDGNGLDCLKSIKSKHTDTKFVMLSAEQDRQLMKTALDSGACGFIPKSSSSEVMLGAINLVLAGGIYIPPDLLGIDSSGTSAVEAKSAPAKHNYQLTDRQLDVLKQMTKGLSNKEIATQLNMSPSTVKVHVAAVLKEFQVKNRTQAVTLAEQLRILS